MKEIKSEDYSVGTPKISSVEKYDLGKYVFGRKDQFPFKGCSFSDSIISHTYFSTEGTIHRVILFSYQFILIVANT